LILPPADALLAAVNVTATRPCSSIYRSSDDKFWPRRVEEIEGAGVSIINEPVRDEVIELRPGQSAASLYALLVGVRNQAQALLDRLESRGVYVPREGQREVVRALYVATRNQVRALIATLELQGLE
jgi:hypothetical protein